GMRTFTTCGQSGALGPSQAQCDTAYAGTLLAGEVTVTGGIQHWTVPATATYRIEVWGAQGANGNTSLAGGRGARMRGDFALTAGTTLAILVGQQGTQNAQSGGGGGGTFVVNAGTGTPLIIAGGGGGARSASSQDGCHGRISEEGGAGSGSISTSACGPKVGGITSGGIVSSGTWGSGGGGFVGNGATDTSCGGVAA